MWKGIATEGGMTIPSTPWLRYPRRRVAFPRRSWKRSCWPPERLGIQSDFPSKASVYLHVYTHGVISIYIYDYYIHNPRCNIINVIYANICMTYALYDHIMAVILAPQAAIQEKINASQRSETKPSGDAEVSQARRCWFFVGLLGWLSWRWAVWGWFKRLMYISIFFRGFCACMKEQTFFKRRRYFTIQYSFTTFHNILHWCFHVWGAVMTWSWHGHDMQCRLHLTGIHGGPAWRNGSEDAKAAASWMVDVESHCEEFYPLVN